ncbi:MAG: ABC transporter substrate-binding protein [Bryobacteraceae bacterium]
MTTKTTRRIWMTQAAAGALTLAGCSSAPSGAAKAPGGNGGFKLGLVYFAPEEGADTCMKGLFDSLKAQGIEEGKNLEVRRAHAQAEIANIPLLIQNYDNQDVDAIVTLTTPCLTAACSMAKKKPVVFTYVYDPIAAGAGTSKSNHLPRITGVGSFPPVEDTIDVIQKLIPGIKSVGTLYNNSEANSNKVVGVAREAFTKRGIKLEEITANSTGEVFQAAQVLTHRNVQALWVTGDNTALQSFDGIVKASRDAKLPLIINDPEFTQRGAVASVGLGWNDAGQAAGKLVARILRGESPQNIPFEEVAVKKVVLNNEVAQKLGLKFPAELIKEAQG